MPNDIFGVKQIYPTVDGGNEWWLDDSPEGDGQIVAQQEETITKNSAGYFEVTNNANYIALGVTPPGGRPSTIECDIDYGDLRTRGYRYNPDDWKNVEMTFFFYAQDVSGDANDALLLSVRESAGDESGDCCDSFRYGAWLYLQDSGDYEGKVRFSKRMAETGLIGDETLLDQTVVVPNFYRRWVGAKFICYNVIGSNNQTQVKLELWLCPSDSATDMANSWTKVAERTDSGTNWEQGGSSCGGTDTMALTWGSYMCGIDYGDESLRWKYWSIREIDYQGTFGGGGGSGGGGDPPSGNCGSIDSLGIKWLMASGPQSVISQSRDTDVDDRWSEVFDNAIIGYEATMIGTFDGVGSDGHVALKHWGGNHCGDCQYEEDGACCCFPAGYKAITSNGLTPIEQIKEGDLVFTHKGRYMKVLGGSEHFHSGYVYTIKTYGTSNYETTATHIHPFLTKNRGWVKAEDLTKNDWLLLPINKTVNDLNTVSFQQSNGLESMLELKTELLTIIGYYLAEGNLTKNGIGGYSRTVFTFNAAESDVKYTEELVKAISIMGFKPSRYYRKEYNTCIVEFSSTDFANWLSREFGHGAKNKRLPQWLIELPNEKTEIVLETYMNGDGYKVEKGNHHSRQVKSISENLIRGMRDIALRLGYKTSIRKHKVNGEYIILGRKVKVNTPYELYFRKPHPHKFNTKIKIDSDYQYNRIRSIEKKYFRGPVYNIGVEEDHSYVICDHTVANCWYDTGLRANGDVQFQVERPHPNNTSGNNYFNIPFTVDNIGVTMNGNTIGLKWIVYPLIYPGGNADNGGVRLQMWVDINALNGEGRPNNNWTLLYDVTDNSSRNIMTNYDVPSQQEIEMRNSDTDSQVMYGGGLHVRFLRRPDDLVPCVPGGGGGGNEDPVCPTGYHWDATRQICVADTGGGGNPDPPVPETLYNDFKLIYNILSDSDGCICNAPPFTPPPDVPPEDCPPGQHWDTSRLECVDDSVPPPPPPSGNALYNFPYIGGTEIKIGMDSGNSSRYLQYGIWIRGTDSPVYDKVIKRGEIALKKVGAPTGLASVVIRNGDTDAIETTLGTINADEVGSEPQYYAAENMAATYTTQDNDRLMIEFDGGDEDNYLVGYYQDGIDGNDTKVTKRSNTASEGNYDDHNKEFASRWYA